MSIIFVTGKGGVGKTRTSLLWAQRYDTPLLVDLSTNLVHEAEKNGWTIPQVIELKRSRLYETFIKDTLSIPLLGAWISSRHLFHNFLELAPNLYELLILKELHRLAQKQDVLVDAPSTGHMIALMESIRAAQSLFDGGRLRQFADMMSAYFENPKNAHVVLVSLPEHSALSEMQELDNYFKMHWPRLKCTKIINRLHKPPSDTETIPTEWRELAFERPRREAQRLTQVAHDYTIEEGATAL